MRVTTFYETDFGVIELHSTASENMLSGRMVKQEEMTLLTETEHYTLYRNDQGEEWPFWLQNCDGEGMSLSDNDLNEILDWHFKENF